MNSKKTLLFLCLILSANSLLAQQIPPYQAGSYSDDFHYVKGRGSYQKNSFNNWFWAIYPTDTIADKWVTFKFNDSTEQGCDHCALLIVKQSTDAIYQDAEIFNNACIAGVNSSCFTQPSNTNTAPFPNGRVDSITAPYPMQNAMADSGAMYLPIIQVNPQTGMYGVYRNAPYYPTDTVAYSVHTRLKNKGKTLGTRGWGFWNTMWDSVKQERFAWFYEWGIKAGDTSVVFMTAITLNADSITITVLPFLDVYQWHSYTINWSNNGVQYFVDDTLVANHSNAPRIDTNTNSAYEAMAYHCWVDNRLYCNTCGINTFVPLPKDKTIVMDNFSAAPIHNYHPSSQFPQDAIFTFSINKASLHKDNTSNKRILQLFIEKYGDKIIKAAKQTKRHQ